VVAVKKKNGNRHNGHGHNGHGHNGHNGHQLTIRDVARVAMREVLEIRFESTPRTDPILRMKEQGHVPGVPSHNGSIVIYRCIKCFASTVIETQTSEAFGVGLDYPCDPRAIDKTLQFQPWGTEEDRRVRDELTKKDHEVMLATKRDVGLGWLSMSRPKGT